MRNPDPPILVEVLVGRRRFPVDKDIRPLVRVLNAHGFRTTFSCSGHRGNARRERKHGPYFDASVAFDHVACAVAP